MTEKHYSKLRLKIITTTLCFSLIPLFVLALYLLRELRVSYTAKTRENLRVLAENRRNSIDLFLDERISQLTSLAYTHSFDTLKDEHYLERVFSLIQSRSKSYIDLGVIDQKGNHVAYSGPYDLRGVNYKDQEWFNAVMLRGIYVSDVFLGFRKFPHFIIALVRRENKESWILRATIDTDIFEDMVRAAQIGQKGEAFLVNKNMVLQTTPRLGGQVLDKSTYPGYSTFTGTRVEEMTMGGEKVLLATTWLKNKEWMLVIKEDPREGLLEFAKARYMGLWLIIGGILIIIAGTVFITNSMISELEVADREKAILDSNLIQSSKMAALGKMAAGIAHEVNNPLAVIKMKAEWLKELLSEAPFSDTEGTSEFADAIAKIEHHVERARKVTHRLLGFARRMEPVQEMVDINRVVEETISFLENEAHHRNIVVKADLSREIPETASDSAQLQQVFLNIIDNAIDAIDKNGEIVIKSFYLAPEKEIVVKIKDTGPGIPPEKLGTIFDPFFTTKRAGEGTGLGLAISYTIVERLGGTIKAENEPGGGAIFTVILPVRKTI